MGGCTMKMPVGDERCSSMREGGVYARRWRHIWWQRLARLGSPFVLCAMQAEGLGRWHLLDEGGVEQREVCVRELKHEDLGM